MVTARVHLSMAPCIELCFCDSRSSEGYDLNGLHPPGGSKVVRIVRTDARTSTPKEVFLTKDKDPSVWNDINDMIRSEKSGGEIPRHALGQVVQGQLDFRCRRVHVSSICVCWAYSPACVD